MSRRLPEGEQSGEIKNIKRLNGSDTSYETTTEKSEKNESVEDAGKNTEDNKDIFQTKYSTDPILNSKIKHLHTLARQGGFTWIQPYIDAYLPAVAYLEQSQQTLQEIDTQSQDHADHHKRPVYSQQPNTAQKTQTSVVTARKLILSPTDSPQLGTLPDLTPVLRCMILQTDLDKCGFILIPLYAAIPCIKRPMIKTPQPSLDQDTHQVAICILLALLLGLYPTSVKFPPFSVRVAIYRRIHCLLTNGRGINFCESHPSLLTLALMEYASYLIPTNLPVEHALFSEESSMQAFFTTCPLTCDAFRQEALQTGEESWDSLEAYCLPIVERHNRACKSRRKTSQTDQFHVVKLRPSSTDHVQDIPFIVPYSIHLEDPTNCIMASEMAFLGLTGHTNPR